MGTKRQRKIAPYFQTHPPFNPVTGQYASFTGELGVSPYCVLMQIAAEDTYDDYVICRGFDTRILVFVDYEAGNPDKPGISVAKPYGSRKAGVYRIGSIYPALLPVQGNATYTPPSPEEIGLRLGQNPGVVDGTPEVGGQPSDLTASLALLYDHNDLAVNWLLLDSSSIGSKTVCEDLQPGVYDAYAGQTILAGETGLILIESESKLVSAKNHTNCDFYVGERISAKVDNTCAVSFTGCSCCDSTDPNDPGLPCCGKYFVVCFNGESVLWFSGEAAAFSWTYLTTDDSPTEKCTICLGRDGQNYVTWSVQLELTCVSGVITARWGYWCNVWPPGQPLPGVEYPPAELIAEGTFNWSSLCDIPPAIKESKFTVEGCEFTFYAGPADAVDGICEPFEQGPPSCCTGSRWVCINNDSREMAFDGGDETWDVTECCPDCTSATVRIRMSCVNGIPRLIATYTCDGVVATHNVDIRSLCTSNDPFVFNIPTSQCFLSVTLTLNEEECGVCDSCCDETRWFCIDDQSKEMTLASDSDTFDVSSCCDCTSAILFLSIQCIGLTNSIRCEWSLVCDGGPAVTGVEFLDCGAEVLDIDGGDCFLQVQISRTDLGCDSCGSTVVTECCGAVPEELTMTIAGGVLAGSHALLYDVGTETWYHTSTVSGTLFSVSMDCLSASQWRFQLNYGTSEYFGILTESCEPFSLTFDVTGNGYGITSLGVS